MIEAIALLVAHVFAALFMAIGTAGVLVIGIVGSAWLLFCWPSTWFRRP